MEHQVLVAKASYDLVVFLSFWVLRLLRQVSSLCSLRVSVSCVCVYQTNGRIPRSSMTWKRNPMQTSVQNLPLLFLFVPTECGLQLCCQSEIVLITRKKKESLVFGELIAMQYNTVVEDFGCCSSAFFGCGNSFVFFVFCFWL